MRHHISPASQIDDLAAEVHALAEGPHLLPSENSKAFQLGFLTYLLSLARYDTDWDSEEFLVVDELLERVTDPLEAMERDELRMYIEGLRGAIAESH